MKKDIKIGDVVSVSGEVYYGNQWIRVDSDGIVEDIRTKNMLVTLEQVDGDNKACVLVKKKYIRQFEKEEVYE